MAKQLNDREPRAIFYRHGQRRIHYVEWGEPTAKTIVFVHGGRDHCRSWDWIASALSSEWRILAVDLCGHGDSDWRADGCYRVSNYVDDLMALVDEWQLDSLGFVGHSLGGAVVSRFAGLRPDLVSKLAVIEGLRPAKTKRSLTNDSNASKTTRSDGDSGKDPVPVKSFPYRDAAAAGERLKRLNPRLTDQQVAHLTQHGMRRGDDGFYRWKFDPRLRQPIASNLSDAELHQLWKQATMPTLLFCGAQSWASNPAQDGRASLFPDARVIEYTEAAHWLHHDQTDRFIADLQEFFSE
ncbi:MAG: alpha/beta hydrolase [Pseudomonadota bacterium]